MALSATRAARAESRPDRRTMETFSAHARGLQRVLLSQHTERRAAQVEEERMSDDLDYALALSLQEEFEKERKKEERGNDLPKNSAHKLISDADCALALSLQEQFENERRDDEKYLRDTDTELMSDRYDPKLIVDERWELLDPHPNIHDLFVLFDAMFFERVLVNASVEVRWSPRMTLCAGVCSYEGRGGLCSVRLSVPLLKLRPRKDLVETLLHEMIHALLFVTERNRDHDGHGPNFCAHMKRINSLTGANITIYHTFHQEVRQYRQHWWRCNGPCRNRPPFYGWVKRAMNRAPSPRDRWWAEHQATCGGSYTKVKEPEGYGKKAAGAKRIKVEEKDEKKFSKKLKKYSSKDIKELLTGKSGEEKERDGGGPRKLSKGKTQSSSRGGIAVEVFSGQGHALESPALSGGKEPASQSERRQKLLEAVEKRQQVAASKGIKRKSGGGTVSSSDIREFFTSSSLQNQKRTKLDDLGSYTNGAVAPTKSNLPSSSRDLPPEYNNSSLPGSTGQEPPCCYKEESEGSEDECVVLDPDSDVVFISDDDEGGEGDYCGDGVSVSVVGMCPVCGRTDIPGDVINSHVTLCLEDDIQDTDY